jgi:hypothetical protein
MSEYRKYRRTAIAEIADWHPDFDMAGVSISEPDRAAGSPKPGDKIARNPANHDDCWLIAADYFAANFEPLPDTGGTHEGREPVEIGQYWCVQCRLRTGKYHHTYPGYVGHEVRPLVYFGAAPTPEPEP